MRYTSRRCRELNGFTWGPIEEVAQLFFGIFVSMIPAMAIFIFAFIDLATGFCAACWAYGLWYKVRGAAA